MAPVERNRLSAGEAELLAPEKIGNFSPEVPRKFALGFDPRHLGHYGFIVGARDLRLRHCG